MTGNVTLVAALAGRRVDAEGTTRPRFPLTAIPEVTASILDVFRREQPDILVCSAACGADLIALQLADQLKIQAHIVLPFGVDKFRETSVVDRPGNWGPAYDRIIEIARDRSMLYMLDGEHDGDVAYSAATERIVVLAKDLSGSTPPVAIAVADGAPRTEHDATEEFRQLALGRGFRLCNVRIAT